MTQTSIEKINQYRQESGEFGAQPHLGPIGGVNTLVPAPAPGIDANARALLYSFAAHDATFRSFRAGLDEDAQQGEYQAGRAFIDAQAAVALTHTELPVDSLAREAGAFTLAIRANVRTENDANQTVDRLRRNSRKAVGNDGLDDNRKAALADHFMASAYDALDERNAHDRESDAYWSAVGRFNGSLEYATKFATGDVHGVGGLREEVGKHLAAEARNNPDWRQDIVPGTGPGSSFDEIARDYRV